MNWNLETAQATWTNRVWQPRLAEVVLAAMAATEEVTGCKVRPDTALGDVALMNMSLDCRVD